MSVCDTGASMNSEALARALEPGFTTKEGAKGMGLPVVESILRQSAKDIGTPGKDTEFGYGLVQPFDALFGLGIRGR